MFFLLYSGRGSPYQLPSLLLVKSDLQWKKDFLFLAYVCASVCQLWQLTLMVKQKEQLTGVRESLIHFFHLIPIGNHFTFLNISSFTCKGKSNINHIRLRGLVEMMYVQVLGLQVGITIMKMKVIIPSHLEKNLGLIPLLTKEGTEKWNRTNFNDLFSLTSVWAKSVLISKIISNSTGSENTAIKIYQN